MKSGAFFLVEVDEDYNNFVNGLMVNNTIDSVEHINRVGKVIGVPKGVSIVGPGDYLLFHHNICRRSFGLKGVKRQSSFYVKDNVYYIPVTEIFMYMKEGDKDWTAISPFCFVKPIEAGTYTLANGLEMDEENYKGMKPLVGRLAYSNKDLEKLGVEVGDIVSFQENSEHEYKLHGNLYYKMKTLDILAVLDDCL